MYVVVPKSGRRQEYNEFELSIEDGGGEEEGTGRDEGLGAKRKEEEGGDECLNALRASLPFAVLCQV